MNKHKVTKLRSWLQSEMESSGLKQVVLVSETGVPQWVISKFLNGAGLSAEYAISLNEFMQLRTGKLAYQSEVKGNITPPNATPSPLP